MKYRQSIPHRDEVQLNVIHDVITKNNIVQHNMILSNAVEHNTIHLTLLLPVSSGDDPGTYMDHSEVQLIRCTASGGTFTLSFRQRTTPPISYNATALELQRTLSALPSLGPLSVFFSQDGPLPSAAQMVTRPALPPFQGEPDGGTFTNTSFVFAATPTSTPFHNSTVCSPRGTQTVVIVFDTTPGPLPSLNADYSNLLDNVNIGASVKVVVFSGGSALNGIKSIIGGSHYRLLSYLSTYRIKSSQIASPHIISYHFISYHIMKYHLICALPSAIALHDE